MVFYLIMAEVESRRQESL